MVKHRPTRQQITDVYTLDTFQAALDKMASRTAVKIAVKPS
jgi:hypothetical protein